MAVVRKYWHLSLYVMKYTGCSGYIIVTGQPRYANGVMHRWLQSMYASLESSAWRRGAENAFHGLLSWDVVLYQIHNSDIRCPLIYLNHIPIRAYIMTYVTGRIVTLHFFSEESICQRQSFFESTIYPYTIELYLEAAKYSVPCSIYNIAISCLFWWLSFRFKFDHLW